MSGKDFELESMQWETRNMMTETYNTKLIAPDGLGFGEGSISVKERLNDQTLTAENIATAHEVIGRQDSMQPITSDDDGCPDGRLAVRVLVNGNVEAPSNLRPKVFGGGLTMAGAGIVGNGYATGLSFAQTFEKGQEQLHSKGINYGAHSAEHTHGPNCGCGAIDQNPAIWKNALKFRDEISSTITALAGETASDELANAINEVYGNIANFVDNQPAGDYSGQAVMENIADKGKVVAELTDNHREVAIVINTDINGYTFDQAKVREETKDAAQVFPVDVPRMRVLAAAFDEPTEQTKAFIAQFIYSLGTAGTLTKGDLHVFLKYADSSEIDFLAHA